MKTLFAIRSASLAIAMSMGGAAFAQDNGDDTSETDQEQLNGSAQSFVEDSDAQTEALTNVIIPLTVTPEQLNPSYRDISPFYRDINAFWRNINPFYRDINAFYRDINPFYGDIIAFWGDINPFYRDIIAFDSDKLASIGEFWTTTTDSWLLTDTAWENAGSDPLALAGIQQQLLQLVAASEAQFGQAFLEAQGGSFSEDFAQAVFARHGIDPNDLSTLAARSAAERSAFFLDWHDSLMQYSGIDHVDHWMSAINWTPAITQIQGSYDRAIVGIIDSQISTTGNLVYNAGSNSDIDGHGAGVASLIIGEHDGQGVMGIAPNATLTAYNPFAADGTASWDDIAAGIISLKTPNNASLTDLLGGNRASVINLSLGESGWVATQGLADVLARSEILNFSNDTVYVIAAGNDGVAQTADVDWSYTNGVSDNAVIFVGSVDPTGHVSGFSNTPGTACLLDNGVCHSGNELMNNFIVAPGELLLVSDGQGGLVRRSGTSFAAPLVSGAITLLHDFWPWLANHPDETAEIIFRSARDLGEPGVDPVYGWGMLDVTASQSPLDFNNLEIHLYQKRRRGYRSYQTSASSLLADGIQSWWETSDVFFTMFEDIGDTYRDFQVPMSSATYGGRNGALGEMLYMQDFISARFTRWLNSGGADSNGDGVVGITQVNSDQRDLSNGWALRYDAVMPRFTEEGTLDMVHTAATLQDPSGKLSLTLGHGEGAMALAGGDGFGMMHDFDRYTGGVNPILGFASGETFMEASYKLGKHTKLSVGYSENRQTADEVPGISDAERFALRSLTPHTASATTVELEHKLTPAISLNGQWTRLREDEALFGVQSTLPGGLDQGSVTNAFSASAHVEMGSGFALDLSATSASTNTRDGQVFNASEKIFSTAGQIALTKNRLLGKKDRLRVALAQPLSVEAGSIEFTMLEVIDRQTGETGPVTQSIDLSTKRRISGEVIYGTQIGKSTQLGLFGHYLSEGNPGEAETYVVGANLGWRF